MENGIPPVNRLFDSLRSWSACKLPILFGIKPVSKLFSRYKFTRFIKFPIEPEKWFEVRSIVPRLLRSPRPEGREPEKLLEFRCTSSSFDSLPMLSGIGPLRPL